MKADELWEKYADPERQVLFMNKAEFIAALHEYGQAVRKRDAEICQLASAQSLKTVGDCDGLTEKLVATGAARQALKLSAAISKEPLE